MELLKYMSKDTVTIVVATGSVLFLGTVIAMNYDNIKLKYKDFKAIFKKSPVTSSLPVEKSMIQNMGNISEVHEGEVLGHVSETADEFNIAAGINANNVGNLRTVNKGKVTGGKTTIKRKFIMK